VGGLIQDATEFGTFAETTVIEFDAARTATFEARRRIPAVDTVFSLSECTANHYPFDSYNSHFNYFRARQGGNLVPMAMAIGGSIQGFEVKPQMEGFAGPDGDTC
jgi:hypothetical protein